jgi:uncharacterized protein (DUF2141 family)
LSEATPVVTWKSSGFRYDSEDRWKDALANSARIGLLNDKGRLLGVTMRAKPGSQSVEFPDLPPGRYAVIVFHDENDNGLLDKNGLGIPIEGYGFSNNATGFFSAPSFDDAAITVGRGQASNSISLGY